MMRWLCKNCFSLDGEELELHIQAHARAVPWSYDEVKQAVTDLREVHSHCFVCRDQIDRDLATNTVRFHSARGYGKTSMVEAFDELGRAWNKLVEDMNRVTKLPTSKTEPSDRDRALQARKNRNTGPARPSGQAARRPRRHK